MLRMPVLVFVAVVDNDHDDAVAGGGDAALGL